MNKLKGYTVKIKDLTDDVIKDMYLIFETYYHNTSLEKFKDDLFEKDKVIILRSKKDNILRGFSTLKVFHLNINGQKVKGIFSGDTIIQHNYWGQMSLATEFCKAVLLEKLKSPLTPFYWYLVSKGYKTYLILTKYFICYAPRYHRPPSAYETQLLQAFGDELFPDVYAPDKNLLIYPKQKDALKQDIADIDDIKLTNPAIKFFVKQNPHWTRGDELCCLGKVQFRLFPKFLTIAAAKFTKRTLK